MARHFIRWRLSIAACVVGSSLATAHAQQFQDERALSDYGPVLAETDDAALPPEPAADRFVDLDALDEGVEAKPAAPDAGIELIKERYPNGAVKVEREVTQDSYGNYIHHGSWKMFDQAGNMVAKGQFADNLREGVWHRWHRRNESKLFSSFPFNQFQEPFVSEAIFEDGQLHGKWTIYDAKQRKVTEWEFSEGERHGLSSWFYATGHKLREIPHRDGAIHGEWIEWDVNGEPTMRDEYQDGRKIAVKAQFYKGNKVKQSEGTYLFAKIVPKTADDWWAAIPAEFTAIGEDERHGLWVSWFPNGQKQMSGEYRNDVEVGRFTWWYATGQKATEGEYKIGKPHGEWNWWHQNGQKSTHGLYALGNPTGRWSGWDETGRLTRAEDHTAPHRAADVADDAADVEHAAELPQIELTQPRPIFK